MKQYKICSTIIIGGEIRIFLTSKSNNLAKLSTNMVALIALGERINLLDCCIDTAKRGRRILR
jgi:hypothetical protein